MVRKVERETHPELTAHLGVTHPPAIVVVDGKRIRARLESPRGCGEISALLEPWLK